MAASSTETTGWAKASPGDDFQDWGVEQMLPLLCEVRPERSSPRQERKQIEWCFCCVPGMSESLNGAMNPGVLEASGGVLCTSDSYHLHLACVTWTLAWKHIFLGCRLSKPVCLRWTPVSLTDTAGLRPLLGLPFPLNPRGAGRDVQNSCRIYQFHLTWR